MSSVKAVMFLLLCVAAAWSAAGQNGPAVFIPANPDDNDEIEARIETTGLCISEVSVDVDGNVIRATVHYLGCILGPPNFPIIKEVEFGPLPAGTYTFEIEERFEGGPPTLRNTQTLVVAASIPAAPALSPAAMVLLALGMAGAALVVMKQR
jgi:hypothetical protein